MNTLIGRNTLFCFFSALVGFALAWYIYAPSHIIEVKAPEIVQADGSRVLERDPAGKAPGASTKPKGVKIERKIRVTVQPEAIGCPACTVDLSLVREKNGAHRVVASSPDGKVVSGIDVPVGPTLFANPQVWASGVSYGSNETWGIWADRDFGPLRISGEVVQTESGGIGGRVRFGVRF